MSPRLLAFTCFVLGFISGGVTMLGFETRYAVIAGLFDATALVLLLTQGGDQ